MESVPPPHLLLHRKNWKYLRAPLYSPRPTPIPTPGLFSQRWLPGYARTPRGITHTSFPFISLSTGICHQHLNWLTSSSFVKQKKTPLPYCLRLAASLPVSTSPQGPHRHHLTAHLQRESGVGVCLCHFPPSFPSTSTLPDTFCALIFFLSSGLCSLFSSSLFTGLWEAHRFLIPALAHPPVASAAICNGH